MEQSYKKGTVADVISTLKKVVDRQEDDEVRGVYRSDPYRLSAKYVKFQIGSVKWHSWDAEKRWKHVLLFQQHISTMEEEFKKPQKSEKKANKKQRKRKQDSRNLR